jgi:hypothetical protein
MSAYSQGGLNYHATVWLGTSNSGTKVFETNIDEKSVTGSTITTVVSTKLEFGKSYYAEVYAFTSVGAQSQPVSLQFNCINTLPEEPIIVIKPPNPSSTSSIETEVISENLDDDGDVVTFSYKWYKNGEHQEEYDNLRNINPDDTTKNDQWKVEVIPNDGFTNGPIGEYTINIANSIPTCTIELPKSSFEYNAEKSYTFKGTYDDRDGDEIWMVGWYLNLEDPSDYSSLTSNKPLKDVLAGSADVENALEFNYEFNEPGTYNVTLIVFDQDSFMGMTTSYRTITIEVTGAKDTGESGDSMFLIGAAIGVIIIIVMLILLMLLRKKRKPLSEREKMYGKDGGLKPGEAYPVEDSDSYFGDDLDRKGVNSLEDPTAKSESLASATDKPAAMPEKAEQPKLPPGKEDAK